MPACPVPARPYLLFIANRKIFTCFLGRVMIYMFALPVTPSLALGRLRRLLYASMLTGDTNR